VLVSAGCDAAGPVPPFDELPTIAVLITRGPPPSTFGSSPADSGLYGHLVVTGTPIQSPYLRADRFEMRRVSDGARFAWRAIDPPRDAVPTIGPDEIGNYFLPRRGNEAGLGSDSVAEGEVYELIADAGQHHIVGRTRVPGMVEFVRASTDGDTVVRWRRTPGAAAYLVDLFPLMKPADDTLVVIHWGSPIPGEPSPQRRVVRVFALDSNYAAFAGSGRVERAGITGAWGVFGSFSWGDTDLPAAARLALP
jgi:predicted RNA-binding protein with TRAM domain